MRFESPLLSPYESGGGTDSEGTACETNPKSPPEDWVCEIRGHELIHPEGVNGDKITVYTGSDGKIHGTTRKMKEEIKLWCGEEY